MFREMRRSSQSLPREECERILREGKTAVLALAGDDGYPYAVPVNYVYDSGKIYFHCARNGHKLDALRRCERVSACVVDRDDVAPERLATDYMSVIVFGRARILGSGEEIYRAVEKLGLKYNPDHTVVEREIRRERDALCCVEITIDHITGKQGKELARRRRSGE